MAQPASEKSSILIVDDTPANLSVLRQILTENGYVVRPALSGEIALKAIASQPPDLILLDIMMPGMDGYEVCSRLKSDNETAHIPIVFISALTEIDDILQAFQTGGVDYITKPFRTEEVLARVKTHLDLQDAIHEKEAAHLMLQTILDSIDNAIITVDNRMQVINCNRSLSSICGNNPDDSASFLEMLQDGFGPCGEVLRKAVEGQEKVQEYRIEYRCGQQHEKTLVLNAAPLAGEGVSSGGAVLVIRDISRLVQLERNVLEQQSYFGMIGKSKEMQNIYELLDKTADLDVNVLIYGESGTGKELIADAIHYASNRAEKPFIKVNCAALSESLLESELFGHVRGAFTGADKDRIGRCEAAEGGTLFLDEIGDISASFQAKLLRFLEQKEFERIGDSKTLKADVRVVAATNQDLQEKVKSREFRDDLFYRLKGIQIRLPPLRERNDDIPALIGYFLDVSRKSLNKHIQALNDRAFEILMHYSWPGNIRELKSVIHYACALCPGDIIEESHLPAEFLSMTEENTSTQRHAGVNDRTLSQPTNEKESIISKLRQTDGNKAKAARLLGISRATLYSKLLRYGIEEQSSPLSK